MASTSNFIISFLQTYNKKSFWNFLVVSSQDIIRSSPSSTTTSDSLHGHWFSRFLKAFKDYDPSMYTSLEPQLRDEKIRDPERFRKYWIEIIQECEKWHHLVLARNKRNFLLARLDVVDREINQIQLSFKMLPFVEDFSDFKDPSLSDVAFSDSETTSSTSESRSEKRKLCPRVPPPPPPEKSKYVVNTPPRKRRRKNHTTSRVPRPIPIPPSNSSSSDSISSSPPDSPPSLLPTIIIPSLPIEQILPLPPHESPLRPIQYQQPQQEQTHQSSPPLPFKPSTPSPVSSPVHSSPQLVCNKMCPIHCLQ
ncbi:hypothetical protein GLOIN_2v1487390 [Rhizophagus clarus]|uniref:Uncharacterized protein n=1 Tax=Rhizophagus clarus TaxID=94130 RepID=A0A8H3LRY5_9GLOM|nr:hypothetical protein GLOIN_2v1487390 [Rhizophagus clarus]